MREVMRQGRSEGRVSLADVSRDDGSGRSTIGVGALAGLSGEVTILDGRVFVTEGKVVKTWRAEASAPPLREAKTSEQATLLVLARVPRWEEQALGDCGSYTALEDKIASALRARGRDLSEPQAIRVRGRARRLALHVIAGACPIAQPAGPKPYRFDGSAAEVEVLGIFVEGAIGRLTHHGRRSHLHALAGSHMGHLDEIELEDATLFVAAGNAHAPAKQAQQAER